MAERTTFSEEVAALIPDSGEGVRLPDSIADWWQELPFHRESPSSIVSFLECPTKWFAERHLEKAHQATGDTILGIEDFAKRPPTQWSVGGTFVHRVLEVFYSEPVQNRTVENLEEIFDFAWETLNKGDVKEGIVDKRLVADYEEMLEGIDRPIASFKSFFRKTYRDIALAIIDMERPRSVRVDGNETVIRLDHGNMKLFGKIDRVDKTLKGDEKIVDYKTGRAPDGEVSVFNKTFLPSGIYALARKQEFEGTPQERPIVGVQLMYLKEMANYSIRTTDEVMEDVSEILDMVDEEMLRIGETGVIPTNPSESLDDMPCKWCPLKDMCPEWND